MDRAGTRHARKTCRASGEPVEIVEQQKEHQAHGERDDNEEVAAQAKTWNTDQRADKSGSEVPVAIAGAKDAMPFFISSAVT